MPGSLATASFQPEGNSASRARSDAYGSPSAASAARSASRRVAPGPDVRLVGEHRGREPPSLVLGQGDVDVEDEVGVAEAQAADGDGFVGLRSATEGALRGEMPREHRRVIGRLRHVRGARVLPSRPSASSCDLTAVAGPAIGV